MVDVGNFPSRELRSCRGIDHRAGIDTLLNSCHQGERLERRAGLPARTARTGGHVDLRGVVVLASDERLDVAVVGVDRHHGDLVVVAGRLLLLARSRLGGLLHGDVKRGVDLQPALEKLVFGVRVLAVGVGQLVAYVAREVRIRLDSRGRRLGRIEHEGLGLSGVVLFLSDDTVREHAVEHHVAALRAVLGIVDRVVVRWRLGNAHKRRRLRNGELACVLREVALRCRLDAIGARTVVDRVQIHEQDVVFGVLLLKLDRDIRLANLTFDRDVVHLRRENRVAHELLRDGRCAFQVATHEVVHQGAADAPRVDRTMGVEALVLRSNRALEHVVADLADFDRVAVLQLEFREHRLAVARVHDRRLRGVVRVGALVIREIGQPRRADRPDAPAKRDDEHEDNRHDGDHRRRRMLLLDVGPAFNRT